MSQALKVLKEAGKLNAVNGVGGNSAVVLLTGTTAALTLQRNDSGKVFVFDTVTPTTVTLPSLADAGVGWSAKFIVNQIAGSASHVVSENAASDTNVIHGMILEADVSTDGDATAGTGVTFVNFTNAAGVVGDRCEIMATSDKWHVIGYGQVDAGVTLA